MSKRERTIALLRGLASLGLLVAFLAGLPLALSAAVGWPLPRSLPSIDEIQTALNENGVPDAFLIKTLAVICWITWVILAACVVVEVVAALRGRQAARVPMAGPMQGMVSRLVSAIILTTSLGRPMVAAAVPLSALVARAAPAMAAEASDVPAPSPALTPVSANGGDVASRAPTGVAQGVDDANTTAQAVEMTYEVVEGDTLWDICDRHLDDPFRWKEVYQMNRGRQQPDGRWLRNPNLIRPGWKLILPPDAHGLEGAAAVATTGGSGAPGSMNMPSTSAPTTSTMSTPTITTAAPSTTTAPTTTTTTTAPVAAPAPKPAPTAVPTTTTTTTTTTTPPATTTMPRLPGGLPAPAPADTRPAPSTTTTTRPAPPTTVEPAAVPAPAPDATLPPPPSTSVTPTSTTVAEAVPQDSDDGGLSKALPIRATAPSLAGAGLLSAGLLGLLSKMRRNRARHRAPGGPVETVEPELAGTEVSLRAGADVDGADFVDLSLRLMAAGIRSEELAPPDINAVLLGPRQLDILLAEARAKAPPWFTSRAAGQRWVLPRSEVQQLRQAAAGEPSPLPALFTVGHTDDGTRVLIDLEEGGLTAIVGELERARRFICSAAAELATSRWSDYVSLVLVGFGHNLASVERVRVVGHIDDVLDELEAEAADIGRALADADCSSTLEARLRGLAGDAWTPTVLVGGPIPAAAAKRLAALSSKAGNAGVAALVVGDVSEANWRLVLSGEQVTVEPLGLVCAPQLLDTDDAEQVGGLLDASSPPASGWVEDLGDDFSWGIRPDDEDLTSAQVALALPIDGGPFQDPQPATPADLGRVTALDRAAEPEFLSEPEEDVDLEAEPARSLVVVRGGSPEPIVEPAVHDGVEVRVLGPVEVDGAQPMARAKSVELVVYLAMHPGAAIGADRLMEALWPGRPPNGPNLNVTTSQARTALGQAADGSYRLPRVGGDRIYRLSPEVGLDYARFAQLVTGARGQDAPQARHLLRSALELVRGRAFEVAGRGYEWAHAEGIITHIDAAVADAAHWLARLSLAADDPEGARWAAERGLRASPGNEQLYRDLMQAADLNGNPAAVESLMDELCRQIEDDEPYASVHPETQALYEQLTRSSIRTRVAAR